MPLIKSDKYTFRSEFIQDDMDIFLNLQNSVDVVLDDEQRLKSISIVDIDVLKENFSATGLNELITIIDTIHKKQKEVFFSIIKEDYLLTLNPIY